MRICTTFEQVHILNSSWLSECWYIMIVPIGLIISIVYYVNHKKKAFRHSLLLLLCLCFFSFGIHTIEKPELDGPLGAFGIENYHEDHFGTSPDYLGKSLEKIYEFFRKFL